MRMIIYTCIVIYANLILGKRRSSDTTLPERSSVDTLGEDKGNETRNRVNTSQNVSCAVHSYVTVGTHTSIYRDRARYRSKWP